MNIERLLQTFLQRYAVTEAKAVAPFIVGSRVLDLGAGESYVGAALFSLYGIWVCSADIGAFRRVPGPYVTYDGIRLPFVDDAFDTTLTLLTLHHCESPERVLDEAVRVTRGRLIVIESVYRNRRERLWLDVLDHRLNRYRHQGGMSIPVTFRRPEEWRHVFESRRLRTIETAWLGPWWERLVHHPLLFVLSVPKDAWSPRNEFGESVASKPAH
jgi:SAM-dependent methyltransferase